MWTDVFRFALMCTVPAVAHTRLLLSVCKPYPIWSRVYMSVRSVALALGVSVLQKPPVGEAQAGKCRRRCCSTVLRERACVLEMSVHWYIKWVFRQ